MILNLNNYITTWYPLNSDNIKKLRLRKHFTEN